MKTRPRPTKARAQKLPSPTPKYLHVDLVRRRSFTSAAASPTPSHLRFVKAGLHAIFRLSDLKTWDPAYGWTAVLAGDLTTDPTLHKIPQSRGRPSSKVFIDAVHGATVRAVQQDTSPVNYLEFWIGARPDQLAVLEQQISNLPAVPKQILQLYHGEQKRLSEVAAILGLTESRICQIHGQTVLGLRTFLKRHASTSAEARNQTLDI